MRSEKSATKSSATHDIFRRDLAMVVYPLVWSVWPPAEIVVSMTDVTAYAESPYTLQAEVQAHPGARWTLDITWPPLRGAMAARMRADLGALRGRYGTVLAAPRIGALSPRGSAVGTPVVDQAHGAMATALATRGWGPSAASVLLSGDYVQVGSGAGPRLHQVLGDVDADGDGRAVLDIWPPLRESLADGATVTTSEARGVFRLASSDRGWREEPGGILTVSALRLIEAL